MKWTAAAGAALSALVTHLVYVEEISVRQLVHRVKEKVGMMIKRRSKKKKMSFYQQKQARSAECLLTIAEEGPLLQHGKVLGFESLTVVCC